MLKSSKLFATMLVAGALAIPASISVKAKEVKANDARIIVEVERGLENLSANGVINTQNEVINNIKTMVNSRVELKTRYSTLANAFLLSVNSGDIEAIKQVPGVKSVTVDELHFTESLDGAKTISITRDGPSSSYTDSDNISAITMNAPKSSKGGEGVAVAILDNEFAIAKDRRGNVDTKITHEAFSDLPTTVKTKYTRESVASLIAQSKDSFHGKPGSGELKSTYFNRKVPFYYDYGGDTVSPNSQGLPDYDVYSTVSSHGSHVASITAGNGQTYKGIAPNAQLVLMKVFTNYEPTEAFKKIGAVGGTGAYDSAIFAALEDCIALGVDAINMSLGSDLNDFDQDSLTLRVLNSMQSKGIIACIAAGNSGKTSYSFAGAYGNWTSDMVETGIMSSYANSQTSMTVASAVPLATFFENAVTIGNATIAYNDQVVNRDEDDTTFRPQDEKKMWEYLEENYGYDSYPWVKVPGFGEAKDYADIDVKGKIAIVDRGAIDFATKVKNAVSAGAIAVFFIDNDPTATDFVFRCSFGDDYVPPVPVAITLYKNRPTWVSLGSGTFTLIKDKILDNDNPYTMSTFSTDGADFTYSLKPDIATPGDGIKGAVSPYDKKKYKEGETDFTTIYEYFSGTSMACPNYCGVVALLLGEHLTTTGTVDEAYKATLNQRTQSTADPMHIVNDHGEDVHSSPRTQGAGMVDITGALNSDVYLEGIKAGTENVGSTYGKICLYNTSDIARGDVALSFLAHNESTTAKSYRATTYIYRPDIVGTNDIVQSPYNRLGELTNYVDLVGSANVPEYFDAERTIKNEDYCADKYGANYKEGVDTKLLSTNDAYSIRTIPENYVTYGWVEAGYKAFYLNADKQWTPVPTVDYQSVKDHLIAEVSQTVRIAPGDSKITLNTYSLTEAQKKEIADFYTSGCALEGYVILENEGEGEDLSIPFLGFYGDYSKAPAVEPFSFEKEAGKVYASDLLNDFAHNTMGLGNADFASTWIVGYSKTPGNVYVDNVTKNDANFKQWTQGTNAKWFNVGSDALTGAEKYDSEGNLMIYVGNSEKSNTMVIQQTVLRSVSSNIITITNEAGNTVYDSYFEEMIGYGDESELFKSHVIGSIYVAHRALAIIPLYDTHTKEAFPDGTYTLKMAYTLAGVKDDPKTEEKENVQELVYKIVIDNTDPVISTTETNGIIPTRDGFGRVNGHETGRVLRTTVREESLSYLVYDNTNITPRTSSNPDEEGYYGFYRNEDGTYSYDIPAEEAQASSEANNGRIVIEAVDQARGHMGYVLANYEVGKSANGMTSIASSELTGNYGFTLQVSASKTSLLLRVFTYDFFGNEEDVTLTKPFVLSFSIDDVLGRNSLNGVTVYDGFGTDRVLANYETETYVDTADGRTKTLMHITTISGRIGLEVAAPESTGGCGGSIATTSMLIASLAAMGIALVLISRKRKENK